MSEKEQVPVFHVMGRLCRPVALKAELMDCALRNARDRLRAKGDTHGANALNAIVQNEHEGVKAELMDCVMEQLSIAPGPR